MCDESLSLLDSEVQQFSEAEHTAYMKGYNDALTERYKYFHLKYIIRSIVKGKILCAHCGKVLWFRVLKDFNTGFCSVKCRDNYLPF